MDTEMTAVKKGISGTGLKLIALAAMLIDHIGAVLIEHQFDSVSNNITDWTPDMLRLFAFDGLLRLIGRFGFPLFAFLIVEGYLHTRNVKKYALNMVIFAILSEVPFDLATKKMFIFSNYQNVFFTLLFGLVCIWLIDELAYKRERLNNMLALYYIVSAAFGVFVAYEIIFKCVVYEAMGKTTGSYIYLTFLAGALISLIVFLIKGRKYSIAKKNEIIFVLIPLMALSLIADLVKTDYGSVGVLTIAVMYIFRANRTKAFGLGCALLIMMSIMEISALLMLIPVSKYNGQRGPKINKYVFYAFYPVHLTILYIIALVTGVVNPPL